MKKYILTLAALAFLASCTNNNKSSEAQDSSQNVETTDSLSTSENGSAVIKFEEDVHDFGKVKEGEKVAHAFQFKNDGDTPLIIKDASATCGCTVPEWPKEPIAPGKTGEIKVVFDSYGKNGLQDKVVTVTANTIPAQTEVHLVGEIIK